MTKREKRERVLEIYAGAAVTYHNGGISVPILLDRKKAALTALEAIDAGKRWRDVLKEFER